VTKEIKGKNGGTLNQYEPGESGNPAGMKKGSKNFSTKVKEFLNSKSVSIDEDGNIEHPDLTNFEVALIALMQKANQGDSRAFNALLDRAAGKPHQTSETKFVHKQVVDYELLNEFAPFLKEAFEKKPKKETKH